MEEWNVLTVRIEDEVCKKKENNRTIRSTVLYVVERAKRTPAKNDDRV